MNDETKIRTIIANECELEGMADSIIAALAFHGYQIVPTPLEDWRRTQFCPGTYPCHRCAASGPNREDVPCVCEAEAEIDPSSAPPCTCARVQMPTEPHEPDCAFGAWWARFCRGGSSANPSYQADPDPLSTDGNDPSPASD